MPTSGARVEGLPEFRADLRALHPRWPEALRDVHRKIADDAARDSRAVARSRGGVQAKGASAIGGRSTEREARVAVLPSRLDAMAPVAFWGAKRHTGWYAARRYSGSRPQHPAWIGNSWQVAVHGQGPYAINDALATNLPGYLDDYLDMVSALARAAFPEH